MPLAVDHIVNTISESVQDARVEAIGFAIMARNVDALSELLADDDVSREALRLIYPFHLAARFLDGSKACGGLMWHLVSQLYGENSIGINYTDKSGLTVLDVLFISILRSHSTVDNGVLGSISAAPGSIFEAAEVDICGRWDADSPCIRLLHETGKSAVPYEWKHMFCHTSAQTMCPFITAIFMDYWSPNINTPSGLFQINGRSCRLDLKIGQLHAFVFVAFSLANSGMPGETLFAMFSCLLCLLTLRADPCSSAQISIQVFLRLEETERGVPASIIQCG